MARGQHKQGATDGTVDAPQQPDTVLAAAGHLTGSVPATCPAGYLASSQDTDCVHSEKAEKKSNSGTLVQDDTTAKTSADANAVLDGE